MNNNYYILEFFVGDAQDLVRNVKKQNLLHLNWKFSLSLLERFLFPIF